MQLKINIHLLKLIKKDLLEKILVNLKKELVKIQNN